MKTTTLARPLPLLAALFLALSFAFACGDDGGDSATPIDLDQYFTTVKEVFDDADDATIEADARLNETPSGAELDTKLAALDTYLGEIDTIFSDAIDRLEDLGVPAAAADDHQDFVDGVRETVDAGNALRDDLRDVSTEELMDDRLAEFDDDVIASVEKADAACLALQEIADAENIDVDLDCEG